MSLRGRLLTASLVLVACGLLVADAATYVALRSFLFDQVDHQLEETSTTVAQVTAFDRRERRLGNQQFRSTTPGGWVQVRDPDGTVAFTITGTAPDRTTAEPKLPDELPAPPPAEVGADSTAAGNVPGPGGPGALPQTQPAPGTYLTVGSTESGGPDFRVRISQSPFTGETIVAAVPLRDMQSTLQRLLAIEAIVTVAVLAASAAVGLWLVRVGLRPLTDISDTAAEIAQGDLSRRISRDDPRTEIGQLGGSLNVMLGQIETAFAERRASEAALRRSEEQLRRFVADASHELRTPLAAVRAYAELFERGAESHPEDLPRVMHNIQKETARMGVLVDDLLLLTRLDQGRPLERAPVDLGAIAADSADVARAVDPDRPLRLVVNGQVEVSGDRMRLRQIADNLLANVRVHTPEATPVEIDVRREGDVGVLRVIDHGPGLPEDESDRVFERFYRADPSRSRADGGTGLGLSIVHAIAVAHGGLAAVSPTPGGGATFSVAIPLLEPGAPRPPSDSTIR